MYQNPVARPITERLVVRTITDATDRIVSAETPNMTEVSESAPVIGFLTPDGIADFSGAIHPVDPEDHILIAHPFDLYKAATGTNTRSCFLTGRSNSLSSRSSGNST